MDSIWKKLFTQQPAAENSESTPTPVSHPVGVPPSAATGGGGGDKRDEEKVEEGEDANRTSGAEINPSSPASGGVVSSSGVPKSDNPRVVVEATPAKTPEELRELETNSIERYLGTTLLEDKRTAVLSFRQVSREQMLSSRSVSCLIAAFHSGLQDDSEVMISILESLTNVFSLINTNQKGSISTEASDIFELLLSEPAHLELLLSLLSHSELFVRYNSVHVFSLLFDSIKRDTILQNLIKNAGLTRFVDLLADSKEIIRNEGLLILRSMLRYQEDDTLSKIIAFQGVFDIIFRIIHSEGGTSGSIVVVDACKLLLALLSDNPSNQNLFRETGNVPKLSLLLAVSENLMKQYLETGMVPDVTKSIISHGLDIVSALVRDASTNSTSAQNRQAVYNAGLLDILLFLCVGGLNLPQLRVHVFLTLGRCIRGCSAAQKFVGQAGHVVQGVKVPVVSSILLAALQGGILSREEEERISLGSLKEGSERSDAMGKIVQRRSERGLLRSAALFVIEAFLFDNPEEQVKWAVSISSAAGSETNRQKLSSTTTSASSSSSSTPQSTISVEETGTPARRTLVPSSVGVILLSKLLPSSSDPSLVPHPSSYGANIDDIVAERTCEVFCTSRVICWVIDSNRIAKISLLGNRAFLHIMIGHLTTLRYARLLVLPPLPSSSSGSSRKCDDFESMPPSILSVIVSMLVLFAFWCEDCFPLVAYLLEGVESDDWGSKKKDNRVLSPLESILKFAISSSNEAMDPSQQHQQHQQSSKKKKRRGSSMLVSHIQSIACLILGTCSLAVDDGGSSSNDVVGETKIDVARFGELQQVFLSTVLSQIGKESLMSKITSLVHTDAFNLADHGVVGDSGVRIEDSNGENSHNNDDVDVLDLSRALYDERMVLLHSRIAENIRRTIVSMSLSSPRASLASSRSSSTAEERAEESGLTTAAETATATATTIVATAGAKSLSSSLASPTESNPVSGFSSVGIEDSAVVVALAANVMGGGGTVAKESGAGAEVHSTHGDASLPSVESLKQISQLQDKNTELEDTIRDLTSTLQSAQEKSERQRTRILDLESELERHVNRVRTLELEAESETRRMRGMEVSVGPAESESVLAQNAELLQQVADLERKLGGMQIALDARERKFKELSEEQNDLLQLLAELQGDNEDEDDNSEGDDDDDDRQ